MNDSGFTIIESMVALCIVSIALLGTSALIISSIRTNVFTKDLTQAIYLAAEERSFLEAHCLYSDFLSASSMPRCLPLEVSSDLKRTVGDFEVAYTPSLSAGKASVEIDVSWTKGGDEHHVYQKAIFIE